MEGIYDCKNKVISGAASGIVSETEFQQMPSFQSACSLLELTQGLGDSENLLSESYDYGTGIPTSRASRRSRQAK